MQAMAADFDAPTEKMEGIVPLLYQSGYFTIKDYNKLPRSGKLASQRVLVAPRDPVLALTPQFNQMMGFTEEEVREMLDIGAETVNGFGRHGEGIL